MTSAKDIADELLKMTREDQIRYLLESAREYSEFADWCRKEATKILQGENVDRIMYDDGTSISMHHKTVNKVDVDVLRLAHPLEYKALCDNGKVSISYSDIKDMGLDSAVTQTQSSWAGFDRT